MLQRPKAYTLFSAFLIVASFPPLNQSWALFFCLVPWLREISRAKDAKASAWQGVWLGFGMSVGGFYWVAYVLRQFAGVSWWIAGLMCLAFCFFNQLQFSIFGYLYKRWMLSIRNKSLNILASATIYTAIDVLVPKLFRDTFGHATYNLSWLRQNADWAGAYVITWLIVLCNLAIWESLRNEKRQRVMAPQWLAFVFFIAMHGYGIYRLQSLHDSLNPKGPTAHFSAIQANVGDFEKIASEQGVGNSADSVLEKFRRMTLDAVSRTPKPDYIVWPETAYPSTYGTPSTTREKLRDAELENFIKKINTPLFFGGYDSKGGKDYNSQFFIYPSGKTDVFHKHILLTFGEYIPGVEYMPALGGLFPQVGNFGRGPGPVVYDAGKIWFHPVICYESLFPWFSLEAANSGSQLILNVTNDSWYGPTSEPTLHLALASFRSIETRLPQFRATNTGISAVVLPDGSIPEVSGLFREEIFSYEIKVYPPMGTLMKKWGDWFPYFIVLLGGSVFGLRLLTLKKRRESL